MVSPFNPTKLRAHLLDDSTRSGVAPALGHSASVQQESNCPKVLYRVTPWGYTAPQPQPLIAKPHPATSSICKDRGGSKIGVRPGFGRQGRKSRTGDFM